MAPERLVARMCSQVRNEGYLLREGHGTHVTLVWLLACVDPKVRNQVALLHKALVAVAAQVRAFTRVRSLVVLHVTAVCRGVVARGTVQQLPFARAIFSKWHAMLVVYSIEACTIKVCTCSVKCEA